MEREARRAGDSPPTAEAASEETGVVGRFAAGRGLPPRLVQAAIARRIHRKARGDAGEAASAGGESQVAGGEKADSRWGGGPAKGSRHGGDGDPASGVKGERGVDQDIPGDLVDDVP